MDRGGIFVRREPVNFTGRLSVDGKLVTDQASGKLQQLQVRGSDYWIGVIRFPIEARILAVQHSIRLDCADGFAIMITLGDSNFSSDAQWVLTNFEGSGQPLGLIRPTLD
jgi:hypothetical protein